MAPTNDCIDTAIDNSCIEGAMMLPAVNGGNTCKVLRKYEGAVFTLQIADYYMGNLAKSITDAKNDFIMQTVKAS